MGGGEYRRQNHGICLFFVVVQLPQLNLRVSSFCRENVPDREITAVVMVVVAVWCVAEKDILFAERIWQILLLLRLAQCLCR